MHKQSHIGVALILISFLLVSCAGAAPTEEVNSIMTAAVSTMVSSFFGTQTALFTPSTPTVTQTYTAFPTNTFYQTDTPAASATYAYFTVVPRTLTPGSPTPTGTLSTPTLNPGAMAVGCNNLFFIRDVTIPAGTVLQKNQNFTKTWKVQNNGSCDWLYQYLFVPTSVNTFGGSSFKLQRLVKAGNWTELSVDMTAPDKSGKYTSYWRMSNGQGPFGATLVVNFVVSDPPTSIPVPSITNTSAPTSTPMPTETFTEIPSPTTSGP
jgi:hypothetical protein